MTFQQGDPIRNVNPRSRYYGMIGVFHHELPWTFWGMDDVLEPACDVAYPGKYGPHGYPYIAQRMSDLELVNLP